MDTALPQEFPFILDRNLAKANCTGNRVCTSCDTVVLGSIICDLEENKYNAKGTMLITKEFAVIWDGLANMIFEHKNGLICC